MVPGLRATRMRVKCGIQVDRRERTVGGLVRLRMMIGVLVMFGVLAPAASAASFTNPLKLTGATGGEPSIVTDPLGDAFVSGP
jgi:hypothetical protein